jgi:hypothetical protein
MPDQTVKTLVANIKAYIKKAKRQGTVGMSKTNLKQVVSTKGIEYHGTNAPWTFHQDFMQAVALVKVKGFNIYD